MEPEQKKLTAGIIVVLIIVAVVFTLVIYPNYIANSDDGGGGGDGPGNSDNKSPVAIMTTNATTNTRVGDPIEFNATKSYDEDGEIILYKWDFGGGTKKAGSELFVINHTFSSPGEKTINLTVQDQDGAQGYTVRTVTIRQSDYSSSDTVILSSQDIIPIEWPENATFFFPIEYDVTRVVFTLSLIGWSSTQDDDFTSTIDIFVKTPSLNLMENRTVDIRGQANETFEYLGYQLTEFSSNYQVDVLCRSGTVSIDFDVDVMY